MMHREISDFRIQFSDLACGMTNNGVAPVVQSEIGNPQS
jgi:hypothetical protein